MQYNEGSPWGGALPRLFSPRAIRKNIFHAVCHAAMSVRALPNSIVVIAIVFVLSAASLSRNADYHTATRLWEDAAQKSPGKARPHYNLGRLYRDERREGEALREYLAAARLEPADPVTHYNIANTYLAMGRTDKAISEYLAALMLKPDYEDAAYNLDVALHILSDRQRAYGKNFPPLSPAARNNLGNLYFSRGNIDAAIREYAAAIRLKPDFAGAHYNLGKAYRASHRLDEAAAEYEIAARLNPADAVSHFNLGNCHVASGRLKKARKEYETALMLDPGFSDARHNLAVVHKLQKGR